MGFPNLPGIPALSNKNQVYAAAATVAAPLINNLLDRLKSIWGIYDASGTTQVLFPDSFISLDYRNENEVSNYPIERGAFSSYNKVRTPYTLNVTVSKGSSVNSFGIGNSSTTKDRNAFLKVLEQMAASLDLYTIITPEENFINANLEEFDFRREVKNGAGMIVASLRFVEIIKASVLLGTPATSVPPDPFATTPSAQASVDNANCQMQPPLTPSSLNLGTPFQLH